MKIKQLTSDYQTDEQMLKRFNLLCDYFKQDLKQNYVEFNGYYLSLRFQEKSAGLRWFHCNKYRIEVVVDRINGPSQNIAPWTLFSNYKDAILSMTMAEEKAVCILKKDASKEAKAV